MSNTVNYTASPWYNGSAPPKHAGTYTVTVTITDSNYAGSGSGSITINKAVASVTPNAASKIYGNADPALGGSLVGFLPTDGVAATYSRTTGETVAGGPYTISAVLSATPGPTGAVLSNYNITYNTAQFTITRTRLQRFVFDSGRLSIISTRSPTWDSLFSSCT